MIKITLEKAFEEAVKKWTYLSEMRYTCRGTNITAGARVAKEFPELYNYPGRCGLCAKYYDEEVCSRKCPLNLKGLTCRDLGHVYERWNAIPSQENARHVLRLIQEKQREFKKKQRRR
jgi:hypothetical protein